jgi:hypothetical protein
MKSLRVIFISFMPLIGTGQTSRQYGVNQLRVIGATDPESLQMGV